jgi:hypothetical protein
VCVCVCEWVEIHKKITVVLAFIFKLDQKSVVVAIRVRVTVDGDSVF